MKKSNEMIKGVKVRNGNTSITSHKGPRICHTYSQKNKNKQRARETDKVRKGEQLRKAKAMLQSSTCIPYTHTPLHERCFVLEK